MTYATLTRPGQAAPLAELGEGGWRSADPAIARKLNILCNPWEQSPAVGDPVVWAARNAAEMLHATAMIAPIEDPAETEDVLY